LIKNRFSQQFEACFDPTLSRPLVKHARPLPHSQSHTRAVLDRFREYFSCFIEVAAGELRSIFVPSLVHFSTVTTCTERPSIERAVSRGVE
jgi:hypothetical protein